MGLYILDYGAGNVQSLANSLKKLGHDFTWISDSTDFAKATVSSRHLLTQSTPYISVLLLESDLSRCRSLRNSYRTPF